MNPYTYAALIAGMIFGALAATTGASHASEQAAAPSVIVRRTTEVADEELKYALERVKDDCEADRQAALLAQTWETDPTAGVVHE